MNRIVLYIQITLSKLIITLSNGNYKKNGSIQMNPNDKKTIGIMVKKESTLKGSNVTNALNQLFVLFNGITQLMKENQSVSLVEYKQLMKQLNLENLKQIELELIK
jgi:hypothetical protein